MYDIDNRKKVVDDHGSMVDRSGAADPFMFSDNKDIDPQVMGIDEGQTGVWSRMDKLEKRLKRMELDRLQEPSNAEEELKALEGRIKRIETMERRLMDRVRSAMEASVVDSVEEEMEGFVKRIEKMEVELERLQRCSLVSISSHATGRLNERLLKRIPKFCGEAAAFPAFKQRFLAYVEKVSGQPSFAYFSDLCIKLE